MLRAWRRATVVALAAGAAITASRAGPRAAKAPAPAVSIAATAKLKPVTGDVFVIYRAGAYSTAKIHGTITGATAGDTATLPAQPSPSKKQAVPAGSITLKGATAAYSFTVTPALATHYAVRLFTSGTTTPVAVSRTQAVYLTSAQT